MMRSSFRALLPLLGLAFACSPPAESTRTPRAPHSTAAPPEADPSTAKACGDAALAVGEASKLVGEGRFLRAAVLLDQAESRCPTRVRAAMELHAQALAEVGRCAGVRRLARAMGAKQSVLQKAEATCAERTRGIGDAEAEAKSRSLAREGQQTLRRGDLALSERLAAQALASAATDEALLLEARIQALKGDERRARHAFDRAFAALERAGDARLVVVPHAAMRASRADGAEVALAGGRLWIYRPETPDRVAAVAWPDSMQPYGYRNTEGAIVSVTGRFVLAGAKSVSLFDIEAAHFIDSFADEKPSLRGLEGGRRALVFKGGDPERSESTKLLDLTDPARLKVIDSYDGGAIDDALDGSAFLIKNDAGIHVVDAATGKIADSYEGAASGVISSDGKLVALCEVSKADDFSGSVETKLILFDRVKNRARWTREGDCSPAMPMGFGARDQTIFSNKTFSVKTGVEASDDVGGPAEEAVKPGAAHWLAASFNENAVGCVKALSGDGALFSAGCHSRAEVFEARTGRRLFTSDKAITLPPRGPFVATEDALCDVRSGTCTSLAKHCMKGGRIFSTDGARLLCASEEGLREIAWDDSAAIKTNRVFPDSKGWLPVFHDSKNAGAMRMSPAAVELLVLDFDKKTVISAGQPLGALLSPDGRFAISATGGAPSVFNYVARTTGALREHAGAIAATLVSPDGRFVGLKDSRQTWRFWGMPEGRLLGRTDRLDRPKPPADEPTILSSSMGLTAQMLSTGYVAGALGARNRWQLNLTQGFWIMPVSDATKLLEARWTGKGGYLMETRLGSRSLGDSRIALLGEGTSLVACGFGEGVVAPIEVCREAFVFNDLAAGVFGAVEGR